MIILVSETETQINGKTQNTEKDRQQVHNGNQRNGQNVAAKISKTK